MQPPSRGFYRGLPWPHDGAPIGREDAGGIDGRPYLLAHDVDVVALMGRIEAAARSAPTFVVLLGDEASVSVLISPSTRAAITVESEHRSQRFDDAPVVPLTEWDL